VLVRLGTGEPRRLGSMGDVVFSPDGKTLISISEAGVVFDDVRSGKEIRRWSSRAVRGLGLDCLSADGRTIALFDQGKVHIHDLLTGQQRKTLELPVKVTERLVLSPDGTILAVLAGDREIWVLESATGKVLSRLVGHTKRVRTIVFSRDSKRSVAGGDEGMAYLWEVASGKLLHRLGKRVQVFGVDFSPDGQRLAVVGFPSAPVTVYDCGTGREVMSLDVEKGQSICYSPRGDLLVVGGYGTLHVFDANSGKEVNRPGEDLGWARSLSFSRDGKTLAVQGDHGTLCLWETVTWGQLHPFFGGHRGPVTSVAFSPDGRLAATADPGAVLIWEAGTGRLIRRLPVRREQRPGALAFSADGRLLDYRAASGLYRLWEVGTWKVRRARDEPVRRGVVFPPSEPSCSAFSPDGKQLATTCYNRDETPTIEIQDFQSGKQLAAWASQAAEANDIVFSRDGTRLLSGGEDGLIREWLTSTGEERRGFFAHKDGVACLALSPDGWTLASAGWDGAIRLWEMTTGKERLRLEGAIDPTWMLAFSPDGRILVAVSSEKEQPLVERSASRSGPDRMPATISLEKEQLRLWQLPTGKGLGVLRAGIQGKNALAISPDSRRLLSGGMDKTARIHDLTRYERFRRPARLPLSAAELEPLWEQLAGDDPRVAYQAIGRLAAAPDQTGPFLARRLKPARLLPEKRIRALFADLDSDRFEVRQKAQRELERLGEDGAACLQRFLEEKPSLEARCRAERIVKHWQRTGPTGDVLRGVRGVEVLEQIGTPAAREVLRTLSRGLPEARLTREANAALERLERKHSASR
jgi:WD40 repeat protein